MKLTLEGFKCHEDREFTFPSGLILLSGASGIGKSTVFQSLYWCLYGSLRNVYSNTGYPKCSVTFQLGPLEVYRQKRPELLRVTVDSQAYEDEVAQQIINQYFGVKEVFLACSYLQQGERCTLLSTSLAERMDILNSISFSGDNPEVVLGKIDENLKAVNGDFTEKQTLFKHDCDRFTSELEERLIDPEAIDQDPEVFRVRLEVASARKAELDQQLVEQTKVQGILENLTQSAESLEKRLADVEFVSAEDCRLLEQQLAECVAAMPQALEFERLTKIIDGLTAEVAKVADPNLDDVEATEQDVWTATKQETDYAAAVAKARRLGIDYTPEAITAALEKAQLDVSGATAYEQALSAYRHFESVCRSLSECQASTTELSTSETEHQQFLQQLNDELAKYPLMDTKAIEDRIRNLKTLASQTTLRQKLAAELDRASKSLELATAQLESVKDSHSQLEAVKRRVLKLEERLKVATELQSLEKRIGELETALKAVVEEPTTVDIDELEAKVRALTAKVGELKRASDVIACPHCQGGVKYYQGRLHACQEACVDPAELAALVQTLAAKTKAHAAAKAQLLREHEKATRRATLQAQLTEKSSQRAILLERVSAEDDGSSATLEEARGTQTQLQKDVKLHDQLKQTIGTATFQCQSLTTQLAELDRTIEGLTCDSTLAEETASLTAAQASNAYRQQVADEISKYTTSLHGITTLLGERRRMLADLTQQRAALPDQSPPSKCVLTCTEAKARLSAVSSLQCLQPPPISSAILKRCVESATLRKSLQTASTERTTKFGSSTPEPSPTLLQRKTTLTQQLTRAQSAHNLRTTLEEQLSSVQAQLVSLSLDPTLPEQISTCTTEIEYCTRLIDEIAYASRMQTRRSELEQTQEACLALQADVLALSKLKQLALLTECQQLQSTVDSINVTMDEIFKRIFDDPITVTLKLFKILKSDKRTKPSVNLVILYKGAEYDSVNQLSGGESARISMGVVLALNRVVGSPILLLDECFGALNGDLREESLSTIRHFSNPGNTTLVISHEDNEADYDDVVQFE